jgi:tryptophan synthase alpha chain
MNRIDGTFAKLRADGRTALIPYVTCGDPSPSATVPMLARARRCRGGYRRDGVPFSDPMADGPVIQRAFRACAGAGSGAASRASDVAEFRSKDSVTPLVLMGYANPIEAMGERNFATRAAGRGLDGVLVVGLPAGRGARVCVAPEEHDLATIFLLSPTTPGSRIAGDRQALHVATSITSRSKVSPAGHLDTSDVVRKLARSRRHIIAADRVSGFGIRDAASAQAIAATPTPLSSAAASSRNRGRVRQRMRRCAQRAGSRAFARLSIR